MSVTCRFKRLFLLSVIPFLIPAGTLSAQPTTPLPVSPNAGCLPFEIQIEYLEGIQPGASISLPVIKTTGTEPMGGFELVIAFNSTLLNLLGVNAGEPFDSLGAYQWEQFSYRVDQSDSLMIVRILGIADFFGSVHDPGQYYLPDGTTLLTLDFITADLPLDEDIIVSVGFYWVDCGVNAIANVLGDSLFISSTVYDYTGADITDTAYTLPGFWGTPYACGPGPTRYIDFHSGGVHIRPFQPTPLLGDLNLNGIAYESVDETIFEYYFLLGTDAFDFNVELQSAATDINGDGTELQFEDFVLMHRIIFCGLEPNPDGSIPAHTIDSATFAQDTALHIVSVDYRDSLAGMYLIFEDSIVPDFLLDSDAWRWWCGYNNGYTKILIYPSFDGCIAKIGSQPLFSYSGEGRLIEAQTANFLNYVFVTGIEVAPSGETTPFAIEIEHQINVGLNEYVSVPVTKISGSETMAGFDFVFTYDAEVMTFIEAVPGILFDTLGDYEWEYFTYRHGPLDDCLSLPCPAGTMRVLALANINDGPHLPLQTYIPDGTELFSLKFYTGGAVIHKCTVSPLRFFWIDCGDNAIAMDVDSTVVTALSNAVYDFDGKDITDPAADLPNITGAPSTCFLNGNPTTATRFVNYRNGFIEFDCGDISAIGDINCNGIAFEIADWVMFDNFHLRGVEAFGNHIEASTDNSDINGDGEPLQLEDFVLLHRVVCGEVSMPPLPPPMIDSATFVQNIPLREIGIEYPDQWTAVHLVFEGEIIPGFPTEKPYSENWRFHYDGQLTRVTIQAGFDNCTVDYPAGFLFSYSGDGYLTQAQAADNENRVFTTLITHIGDDPMVPLAIKTQSLTGTRPGELISVPVVKTAGSAGVYGFEFLVAFDANLLNFRQATPGILFDTLGGYEWEYFTYRYAPLDDAEFFSGMVRVVALADMNNGSPHPNTIHIPDGTELFSLNFVVLPPLETGRVFTPVNYYWADCTDNAAYLQLPESDALGLSRKVFNIQGDEITNPDAEFPTCLGAPEICLTVDPPDSLPGIGRLIDFYHGDVEIVFQPDTGRIGDINCDGVTYTVADLVLLNRYFMEGLSAFGEPGSGAVHCAVAASDVNYDGHSLGLEDLIYYHRLLNGCAWPYDTLFSHVQDSVTFVHDTASRTVSLRYQDTLAAVFLVFEGDVFPTFFVDTTQFFCWSRYSWMHTFVMIQPRTDRCGPGLFAGPLFSYTGHGHIIPEDADRRRTGAADWRDHVFSRVDVIGPGEYDIGMTAISPSPVPTWLARTSPDNTLTVYLGGFAHHSVNNIDPATIRINDVLQPLTSKVIPSLAAFDGEVLELTVNARDFILMYPDIVGADLRSYTVSGGFDDLASFVASGTVTLEESSAIIPIPSGWPVIQAAVDAALSGDVILLADGIFSGSGNTNLFFGGKSLSILSENGPSQTIIDCNNVADSGCGAMVFDADNLGRMSVSGLTFRLSQYGAAVSIVAASPTFNDCIFTGNNAEAGGAVYISDAPAAPVFSDCRFSGNTGSIGGAVAVRLGATALFERCTFDANQAEYGGAVLCYNASPDFINCDFTGNTSATGGGAVFLQDDCSPSFDTCAFVDNNGGYKGGAFFIEERTFMGGKSEPRLTACLFTGNQSQDLGGALSLEGPVGGSMHNCTFVGNAAETGGGLYITNNRQNYGPADPVIANCIFAFNENGGAVGLYQAEPQFVCTDIYGNISGDWLAEVAPQGDINGNFSADPLFCDPYGDDYHLQDHSPCAPANNACGTLIGVFGVSCIISDAETDSEVLPDAFSLSQNFPNPFNPITEIAFNLPQAAYVRLDVFNITGQKIVTLHDGEMSAGEHRIIWDSKDASGHSVATGIYFYRLQADDFTATRKMILMK